MSAAAVPMSTLPPVDSGDEGQKFQRRRQALGLSVRALAEKAGVDRSRITRLEAGEEVRHTTVAAVEQALAAEERRLGMDLPDREDEGGMVEIRVEGNFGVTAVVKGPVRDIAALQKAAEALVAKMQNEPRPTREGETG